MDKDQSHCVGFLPYCSKWTGKGLWECRGGVARCSHSLADSSLWIYTSPVHTHTHTTCQKVRTHDTETTLGGSPPEIDWDQGAACPHLCLQSDRNHHRLKFERFLGVFGHKTDLIESVANERCNCLSHGTDQDGSRSLKRASELLLEWLRLQQPVRDRKKERTSGCWIRRREKFVGLEDVAMRWQPPSRSVDELMHQCQESGGLDAGLPYDMAEVFTWLILLFSLASRYLGSSVVTVYLSLVCS